MLLLQITKQTMAYQLVAIGHAPNEGLLKCDILYICAAVDKISTETVSHGHSVIAVPFVKFWNPHPMFGTGTTGSSIPYLIHRLINIHGRCTQLYFILGVVRITLFYVSSVVCKCFIRAAVSAHSLLSCLNFCCICTCFYSFYKQVD